jgi:hypothetical protein
MTSLRTPQIERKQPRVTMTANRTKAKQAMVAVADLVVDET